MTYDNGGYIKPGLVRVTTGKPEPILPPKQWRKFK